jgi:prevent-host-death family protein
VDDTITATEATRHFSALLRRVNEGNEITVTIHGQPVADIIPHRRGVTSPERERMHHEFIDFLRTLPARNIGPWTRDELYDDDWDSKDSESL